MFANYITEITLVLFMSWEIGAKNSLVSKFSTHVYKFIRMFWPLSALKIITKGRWGRILQGSRGPMYGVVS